MSSIWPQLLQMAQAEVASTLQSLPDDLRLHAAELPVVYEAWPSDAVRAEGFDDDLLGLFVGDPLGVASLEASPVPRQIVLFLENLWDFSDENEETFQAEVRVTYIHEFGHYLGLDEGELEERGLL